MKLFSRRNTILGVVIVVVSLLSATIGALVVGSSLDQYIASLDSIGRNVVAINSVKPHAFPGSAQEALAGAKEKAEYSSLPIVNIKDRVHRDGVVVSRSIGTATALTTDGWVLMPDSVMSVYGKNAKIVLGGEVHDISEFVQDPASEYGFAKTTISDARVGTFGSSVSAAQGDYVFVISGEVVYPRTISNENNYDNELSVASGDVLSRSFLLDQAVDVPVGAMVTNAVGELIGLMIDGDTVRPLHHMTPALETVLLDGEVNRAKIGMQVRDVMRIVDVDEEFREGWRVVSLDRRGAAEKSGLLIDDVIMRIQGQNVGAMPLAEYVATGKVDGQIQLHVQREETEIEIFVTLE
ncbi:MAG TPA: S1C family serine protease [Patescibacteria group bacterium]|nr:S1C family serine protease [Patescibacteria group bacterium]